MCTPLLAHPAGISCSRPAGSGLTCAVPRQTGRRALRSWPFDASRRAAMSRPQPMLRTPPFPAAIRNESSSSPLPAALARPDCPMHLAARWHLAAPPRARARWSRAFIIAPSYTDNPCRSRCCSDSPRWSGWARASAGHAASAPPPVAASPRAPGSLSCWRMACPACFNPPARVALRPRVCSGSS